MGHDAQHCDSHYNNINHIIRKCSDECLNFTQCCCSECRYAKCHGAKKITVRYLRVVQPSRAKKGGWGTLISGLPSL